MNYYLMHYATGAPVLALTFTSTGAAYRACVQYFGCSAWQHTVVLAAFDDEGDLDDEDDQAVAS